MSSVPWPGEQCIVCVGPGPLTVEHIIPNALGGELTCSFLCKPCNDRFGHGFEARAKEDPALRLVLSQLQSSIPRLHSKIEEGQRYLIKAGPAELVGVLKNGAVRRRVKKLDDGSLMVPDEDTPETLKAMLKRDGHSEAVIDAAIERQANAPVGERVWLTDEVSVVNWSSESHGFDFRGAKLIPDLVLVKIAYEFLALLIGTAIYDQAPQLNEIRVALLIKSDIPKSIEVERLSAPRSFPMLGIAFEGNEPHARFQIRLLGSLVYRVHFKSLAVKHSPIAYTHDLKTGEDWRNGPGNCEMTRQLGLPE